jgi:uncharacterized membrane protein YhaH (DUF805 family)
MIKKFFAFAGRIGRLSYLLRGMGLGITTGLLFVLGFTLFLRGALWWLGILIAVAALAALVVGFASLVARRLHDMNWSGYHAIWVVPVVCSSRRRWQATAWTFAVSIKWFIYWSPRSVRACCWCPAPKKRIASATGQTGAGAFPKSSSGASEERAATALSCFFVVIAGRASAIHAEPCAKPIASAKYRIKKGRRAALLGRGWPG